MGFKGKSVQLLIKLKRFLKYDTKVIGSTHGEEKIQISVIDISDKRKEQFLNMRR
jgi:hypothetical protein